LNRSWHERQRVGHQNTAGYLYQANRASIVFNDIEALLVALGGQVHEREGSRVKITIKDEQWRCHRPHPGKEAKRYQIEEIRELLERIGVHP
jgi:hypothetical protein